MKLTCHTAVVLMLLALAAWTTKPPDSVADFAPVYDFAQSKTIGFSTLSAGVTGNNPPELTDFQRDRIDAALKSALKAKGSRSWTKQRTQTCC